jgi:hypothetical protein
MAYYQRGESVNDRETPTRTLTLQRPQQRQPTRLEQPLQRAPLPRQVQLPSASQSAEIAALQGRIDQLEACILRLSTQDDRHAPTYSALDADFYGVQARAQERARTMSIREGLTDYDSGLYVDEMFNDESMHGGPQTLVQGPPRRRQ